MSGQLQCHCTLLILRWEYSKWILLATGKGGQGGKPCTLMSVHMYCTAWLQCPGKRSTLIQLLYTSIKILFKKCLPKISAENGVTLATYCRRTGWGKEVSKVSFERYNLPLYNDTIAASVWCLLRLPSSFENRHRKKTPSKKNRHRKKNRPRKKTPFFTLSSKILPGPGTLYIKPVSDVCKHAPNPLTSLPSQNMQLLLRRKCIFIFGGI